MPAALLWVSCLTLGQAHFLSVSPVSKVGVELSGRFITNSEAFAGPCGDPLVQVALDMLSLDFHGQTPGSSMVRECLDLRPCTRCL